MWSGIKIKDGNSTLRIVAWIIPAAIAVLLTGSILFYKERMLFIDAPHIFFRILNDGHLHIEENRVGSFVTQMVPLLGAQLHLPFKLLLILYSASFYLFYIFVALVVIYRYKNYELAILFGFYLTLLVSDTYYWPNNEVHQGVAWLILGYAMLLEPEGKSKYFSLFVLAIAIWTHPLVMFLAIYIWAFRLFTCDLPRFTKSRSLLITVMLLGLSFLKYYQSSHHGYDNTKIEVVHNFDFIKIAQVFNGSVMQLFVHDLFREYWLLVTLFISGVALVVWQRKYLLALFVMCYAVCYLLLVCLAFNEASTVRFHLQSEYMPLSIICCAPFVYFLLPKLKVKVAAILLLFIFLVRFCYINAAAQPFSARVNLLDAMNNKMKEKGLFKVIVPEPVPHMDSALIINWGIPVESIILSKLKGEQPQRTFIFAEPEMGAMLTALGKDTVMGCWQRWGQQELNQYYFQQDNSTGYQVVHYDDLMK